MQSHFAPPARGAEERDSTNVDAILTDAPRVPVLEVPGSKARVWRANPNRCGAALRPSLSQDCKQRLRADHAGPLACSVAMTAA